MQCTECNSDNVQKLSLVYEQGTQNINATSSTITNHGFGQGFSTGTTRTSGTTQSITAQRAAPPAKKKIIIPIVAIVAGFVLAKYGELWGLLVSVVGGIYFYTSFLYNRNVYPRLYANWQNSWLCNKCGAIYMQQSKTQAYHN